MDPRKLKTNKRDSSLDDSHSNTNEKSKKQDPTTLKGFYIVEKILDKKNTKDGVKYKIKWMNWPLDQSSFFNIF